MSSVKSEGCAKRDVVNGEEEEYNAKDGTLDHAFNGRDLHWGVEPHNPRIIHRRNLHKLSPILWEELS